jgi:hypothetical protein
MCWRNGGHAATDDLRSRKRFVRGRLLRESRADGSVFLDLDPCCADGLECLVKNAQTSIGTALIRRMKAITRLSLGLALLSQSFVTAADGSDVHPPV